MTTITITVIIIIIIIIKSYIQGDKDVEGLTLL